MNFWEQIKYNWNINSSAVKRLLIVNLAFFGLAVLVRLFYHLFGFGPELNGYVTNPLLEKLALYSSPEYLLYRPWSLITYMFMHNGLWHIVFNMLILFFIGRIAEDFYRPREIYTQYFLGGIAGALLFMLAYNIFPVFTRLGVAAPMVGASASVIALVVATAALVPDYEVMLWGIVRMKLKWLALIMVGLDIVMFTNGNEGGRIAHIGGAGMGLLFALHRNKFDIRMPQWQLLKRSKKPDERKIFKGIHRQDSNLKRSHRPHQEEIDAILDKISQSGYSSLSREEKEILFRASEKDRN